jgi:hypothetical protein
MGSATVTKAEARRVGRRSRAGTRAAGICRGGGLLVFARPSWHTLAWSLLLVLPGLWLRGYAAGYVKKNAELTRTGPYAYTRNPLYLGSMGIAAGFAVAAGQLVAGGAAAGGDVSGDLCADDSFGGDVFAGRVSVV